MRSGRDAFVTRHAKGSRFPSVYFLLVKNGDRSDDNEARTAPGAASEMPSLDDVAQSPPSAETVPTERPPALKAVRKLGKKQKALLKDAHRPLKSWERYRALTDALDEAHDLVDLGDHKARFALIIAGALNVFLYALGASTDIIDNVPQHLRFAVAILAGLYAVLAIYNLIQAIESLRPRRATPYVHYSADTGGFEEYPVGLRFYEDILSRDMEAYRKAWREVRVGQLNNEVAVQLHALAAINRAKFAALDRLYRGLQLMTVFAVVMLLMGTAFIFHNKGEKLKLKKHAVLNLGAQKDEASAAEEQGSKAAGAGDGKGARGAAPPRDWARFPAVVERTTSEDIVGLGDVHGGYDRLLKLLSSAGLIKPAAGSGVGYAWVGGRRILVSVGDLIDKGDQGLPVLDLMMALETQAVAAGGDVIVTLGNHEAEFLADPINKKAKKEFVPELRAKGLDPEAVAGGEGQYGQWLRSLPVAAKVNGWFFAHGGNTAGQSITALGQQFRTSVDANDWGAPFVIGDNSILEAQKWWKKQGTVEADLAALHARHIVFGHDPGAFDQPSRIATAMAGRLFRIDVGMSPAVNYSPGALLIIHRVSATEQASSLDASGHQTMIWQGPA